MQLFEKASARDRPEMILNLSVKEAKLTLPDESGGNPYKNILSGNPFVTFYLKSNPYVVQNTSCKTGEGHEPQWNEEFVIRLPQPR